MSLLVESARNVLVTVSSTLNQSQIKQRIKECAGLVTFAMGCVQVLDFSLCGTRRPTWDYVALSSRVSVLLSASVSPMGVSLISSAAHRILTVEQIAKFGPNTIFAVNPWHPRHVVSFAAALFALPACIQAIGRRLSTKEQGKPLSLHGIGYLCNSCVKQYAIVALCISRPMQHILNQLVSKILAR